MKKYRTTKHRGLRQPVYGDGRTRRIISAPNDTWIAQVLIGENQPRWEDVSRATTKQEAMRITQITGDQT